jgi:DNA repair protein RadA/Sms
VVLLGGEPGIGKSTLLLQLSLSLKKKVLYVSGEESQQQIKLRADRMGLSSESCFLLSQTETHKIFDQIPKLNPQLLIIDSIQTLHTPNIESGAGSVSQIKASAAELIKYAKTTNTPVILVGHITKDGAIAGPKILEHMVDTVLQFEGDRNHIYRILRAQKNRFGATSEIGIYEMQAQGLREVKNPSEVLISAKDEVLSGHAIAATVEGIRPMMIEVQALVSSAVYGTPQRSSTGFNAKRLNMLLAVLEKRAGFALGSKDVFINITGGINIEDPALDLAVVAALLSSFHDLPISQHICFAAEIGLSGEIRPVAKAELRIQEAEKLGFESIAISKFTKLGAPSNKIKIVSFNKVEALVDFLF